MALRLSEGLDTRWSLLERVELLKEGFSSFPGISCHVRTKVGAIEIETMVRVRIRHQFKRGVRRLRPCFELAHGFDEAAVAVCVLLARKYECWNGDACACVTCIEVGVGDVRVVRDNASYGVLE